MAEQDRTNAAPAPHRDLREWIQQAEALGELRTLRGADSNLEIGTITEIAMNAKQGPAVLFDDIPGFPSGYRLLSNSMGSAKRLALTAGLDPNLSEKELMAAWTEKAHNAKPIPVNYVTSGPVTENVLEGDDIDVLKFPTPFWHEHDGGRYIGTGSVDITVGPDDGVVNLGTYRVMVRDKKSVFFYISPGKHGRIHRDKWFDKKEPMPVIVSVGHDPLIFLAGSLEIPYGINELEWAGAIKGEPIDCIKGKYTGLPFPATAEIVIEGYAHYDKLEPEGPFGEWTGYYASDTRPEPWIEIKAIYHRNNPIILGSPPGKPPTELSYYRAFTRSAMIKEEIEKAGCPDVKGVWLHEAGAARLLLVVSIKQRYPGHAKQAAMLACACHAGNYLGRYVIVVDEDIDETNLDEVMWAVVTRSEPAESIDIIRRCWSGPLDPRIPQGKKGHNSRAIIDATRPWEWKDEYPLVARSSPELHAATMKKWGDKLFR